MIWVSIYHHMSYYILELSTYYNMSHYILRNELVHTVIWVSIISLY